MTDASAATGQALSSQGHELDPELKRRVQAVHARLADQGKLLSRERLEESYQAFASRFGPDKLAGVDGQALLTMMHDHGDRDSLVYWLEFKNDETFPAAFGSIAGGSALKFGIYRRRETGEWMAGSPQQQRVLTLDEAQAVARKHRDELLQGVKLLDQLPVSAGDDQYQALQEQMDKAAPTVGNLSWGHKYLSLLYHTKLDDYHSPVYQRHHLVRLLQTPPEGQGRYLCAGRYVALAAEFGLPLNHLTRILNELHGEPYRYWRVLARYEQPDRDGWPTMRDEGCATIGWAKLPDLSPYLGSGDLPQALTGLLAEHYPDSANPAGDRADVSRFARNLVKGDVVVATHGGAAYGVGRVTGDYLYEPGAEFPHRRSVEWLALDAWRLPGPHEGKTATVYEFRGMPNQVAIETAILQAEVVDGRPPLPRTKQLTGAPGRIQGILDRKGQVIIYGPPGTGKTYWAQLTARELAARHAFGKAYADLTDDERQVVDGAANPARLARLCSFHPGYGYEDFLEGYRPEAAHGQMVFVLRDGLFKQLCRDALGRPDQHFYLVIDEINRGDVPRIFGELLTLLERDKRGQSMLLPLSQEPFQVPANVYVIGTMNTADRSIALLDTALRRRFGFVELLPDPSLLANTVVAGIPLGPWLEALNRRIREHLGHDARNRQIGHSYLLDDGRPVTDLARLARVVHEEIVPLLQEYCYEDYSLLEKILGTGLLDLPAQRVRDELFEPAREADLIQALLSPCPEITTSAPAVTSDGGDAEDEQEDEPATDEGE